MSETMNVRNDAAECITSYKVSQINNAIAPFNIANSPKNVAKKTRICFKVFMCVLF